MYKQSSWKRMFFAFYTGFIEKVGYGTKNYFSNHPHLSNQLIEELLKRNISIIGIDFSGVRRGKEHTTMDQHCANHGVFNVENLCHLKAVLKKEYFYCTYVFDELYKYDRIALQIYCRNKFLVDSPLRG